jgi:hypothetical protein
MWPPGQSNISVHRKGALMSIRSVRRRLVLLAGLGLALSAVLPMLSAAAEPTSVAAALTDSATLVGKGGAVEIPVVYTCSTDATWGGIDLFVTERVPGNRTAQGWGSSFSVVCDGTQHTSPVTVPSSNGIAFHTGTAVVQGNLHACDEYGYCTYVPLAGTVDVKK